ncbi:DUF1338 domain-containing protein [Marinibactrum halimedae]|uniref:2-oxoadipate dioxygenase/decarboxylase n=2 Tax=Marinibactrum halimedae TaxID=1444977 RepID=A0AA37WMD4_9GAMM|nr:DUF1338 domain-containing protein [Marinibactrum halimedae]
MTHNALAMMLDEMWVDYISMTPHAQKIVDLLAAKGETIINDHIALRTFNHPSVNINVLSKPFLELGYQRKGKYEFEEKQLDATHFEHEDKALPKIFISELRLESFSQSLQAKIDELIESVDKEVWANPKLSYSGRPWELSRQEYELLKEESEYCAWVAALGYRPNHFTIFVNALKNFSELSDLNQFLKEEGFSLNNSGGEIKGSKAVFLEQSSTLADSTEVRLSDDTLRIPSCYFEFAKRYVMENGELYQGFVAKSADKIFESTEGSQ